MRPNQNALMVKSLGYGEPSMTSSNIILEFKTRGRSKSRTYRHNAINGEQINATVTAQPESRTVLVTASSHLVMSRTSGGI